MKYAVLLSLLAVAVSAQNFPFTDGPLEESIHSNKVFFDISELGEIAGVWNAVNVVFHAYGNLDFLYDGVSQHNLTCEDAAEYGWDYDHFITKPRALTIEVDPERLEDGALGYLIESEFGATVRSAIMDYDGTRLTTDDETCRRWRPYLDWELGKTMMIRNLRFTYWAREDGTITNYGAMGAEECIYSDDDHPTCTEGSFTVKGEQHDGIIFDVPAFYECIAGPCLDLPHTIPEFVQTQGYVPAFRQQEVSADAGK